MNIYLWTVQSTAPPNLNEEVCMFGYGINIEIDQNQDKYMKGKANISMWTQVNIT